MKFSKTELIGTIHKHSNDGKHNLGGGQVGAVVGVEQTVKGTQELV